VSSRAAFVARATAPAAADGALVELAATATARGAPTATERGAAFGVLAPFVGEAGVSDVFVNPDGTVWLDRGSGAEPVAGVRIPGAEARDLAVRLIALGGRHVDEATPCVDVRLGTGVRVHVVLPPVATGGAAISIRLQSEQPITFDELVADSFFCVVAADRVRELVARRANLLITGAGGWRCWHEGARVRGGGEGDAAPRGAAGRRCGAGFGVAACGIRCGLPGDGGRGGGPRPGRP
jgi:Flp pilus assembly CpaF family ATPase